MMFWRHLFRHLKEKYVDTETTTSMKRTIFETALAQVLEVEGAFSDIEADRGGKTNWGITESVARGVPYLYQGEMRELPLELASRIYREKYWDFNRLNLGEIGLITEKVAYEIFEQAVNTGVYSTAKRTQRAISILNRDETLFADLKVDGWLGQGTRDALNILIEEDDEHYLLQWLNVMQGAHYLALCENDPSQEIFARGWIDKRVEIKGRT